jgi:hypothetical protein
MKSLPMALVSGNPPCWSVRLLFLFFWLRFACFTGRCRVAPAPVGGAGGKPVLFGPIQPDLPGAAAGGQRGFSYRSWDWESGTERASGGFCSGLSLAVNLGLLVGFKLVPLLTAGASPGCSPEPFVLLFSVAYLHHRSLSWRDAADAQLPRYLASALFFPSMTAGPIPRQGKLLEQLARPFAFTAEDGGRALLLIGIGLVKKLLIADYLANNLVGRVFDTPALYSSVETLVGVYGYALQLFFDFSGYTDIAMGAALLLGIRCRRTSASRISFGQPGRFLAALAHHLLQVAARLPLRRASQARKHPLLSYSYAFLITFTLGGLWHGISWNFLIWGVLARAGAGRGVCVEAAAQASFSLLVGQRLWAAGHLPLCLLHVDILPGQLA